MWVFMWLSCTWNASQQLSERLKQIQNNTHKQWQKEFLFKVSAPFRTVRTLITVALSLFLKAQTNHTFSESLERFSFECCKTKTKVITLANHKEHRQYSEPIKTQSNYMRGKMHANTSQVVLVLLLTGWKSDANLLSQSRNVVNTKPITFWH